MSEPYENTLSLDDLRRAVRRSWDDHIAFSNDLKALPEVPSLGTMRILINGAMNGQGFHLWDRGKLLQRHYQDSIPYQTEYEFAAGLWSVMRDGILVAAEATRAKDTSHAE